VFGAEKDAVSGPVQTPFGWHLVRVTTVNPEQVRGFEEVREDLARELRLQRAGEQLPNLATRLDDEVAAGTPLVEAAEKHGLAVLRLDAVDRQGQNAKQEAVAADRLTPEMLEEIFAAVSGETSLLKETRDGSYYMFHVEAVEPARPRTLDEVRSVLVDAWTRDQQAERARAQAEALRGRITDAASMAAVAESEGGLTLRDVGPIRRDDQGYLAGLMPPAVKTMFETPPGTVAAEPVPALDGSAVLLVESVIPSQPDPRAVSQASSSLADELRADLLQQYEAALRRRFPPRIDDRQLAQLMEAQVQ
jgi:peptidyl-prolyl cis-trans isomerase D